MKKSRNQNRSRNNRIPSQTQPLLEAAAEEAWTAEGVRVVEEAQVAERVRVEEEEEIVEEAAV